MNNEAVRADFFDASALVKVYSDEPGSDVVCEYFRNSATKYTTPYCFYEALNVLKGKWKFKSKMTIDQYFEAAFQLAAWYGESSSHIADLDFTDPATFGEAKQMAKRHCLDLSDAFQILSVRKGFFSGLANESSTVLVTSDKGLADAAKMEGLRVWHTMLERAPL